MKYLLLFEELKIKKTKRIYKHLDDGRGGAETIMNTIDDTNDVTGDDETIGFLSEIFKKLLKRFNIKSKVY